MANALGRPDLNLWITRYQIAEEHQRKWRSECHENEQFYELSFILDGIPSGINVTIPSTARALIDEATDHSDFSPEWLKIHLPTYGMHTDAELDASRLRAMIAGWLSYQLEYENDISPFRDWIKNVYLHGKGVYKIVTARDRWPELEIPEGTSEQEASKIVAQLSAEREFAGIPAVLRSVYPTAIYEDPSIGEKRWVIEAYEYDAVEILPLYEEYQPSEGSRQELEEQNRRLAVWDCYQVGEEYGVPGIWHTVYINEASALSEGDVTARPILAPAGGPTVEGPTFLPNEPFPYVIKFSGLGRQGAGRYEEKARGILAAVKSLLKAEARRQTQLDSIIAQMAWPTIFVTGSRSRFQVAFGPNVVNYVPSGTEVTPIVPPLPVGPIQQALATIQAGIERGTFGSVIRGDKPPNTTSAAQLAILSGQARLRFGAINIQHEAALAAIAQKLCHIIKHVIQEPVSIWQTDDTDVENPSMLELKPSQIPDRLVCRFTITTDPVEERDREIQLASFMYERGVIDLEEFRERAGIKDTAAMRRRVIRDKVLMESPAVIAALGESFLLESGYDIESLTLEKMMRDMLILRRQAEMQQRIMGGDMGGTNPMGSQPGAETLAPNPPGGAPGMGGAPAGVPTSGSELSNAVSGVYGLGKPIQRQP